MCKYGLAANGFYLQDKNRSHVPRLGSLACCVKGVGPSRTIAPAREASLVCWYPLVKGRRRLCRALTGRERRR